MAVTVFRETVAWVRRFGDIFDIWRKQPDAKISLEGIIDFLAMHTYMDKIRSLSYMKLLRNCHHLTMAKCFQFTIVLSNHATYCYHQQESELLTNVSQMKALRTNNADSIKHRNQDLTDVVKEISTDQPDSICLTGNVLESLKPNNMEPHLVQNPEMVRKELKVTTFKCQISPPIKSKFFESFTSSESEGEDDDIDDDNSSCNNSWDDSDNEEDNSILPSRGFISAYLGMDEYDSSGLGPEMSDEEDESDDDILFCDDVKLCVPSKRVRFESQAGFYEVDSRWSDEDLMEARRGPWVECARDRSRFKRRIEEAEKISWIFKPSHRDKVFERNRQLMGSD